MVDLKYILGLEKVGQWANIEDVKGGYSTTLIESQNMDLTGGFIAEAVCKGYSIVVTENCYTGDELYTGGSVLL